MKLFARITKVDEAKREVWGRAIDETPDNSDEVFDYATSVPYFKAWSSDFEKITDGRSLGNVRAMHGNVAAGKLTELIFVDAERAIDVCSKVVDDNEWKKVLEGVYTGYSIGGKYVKKWADGSLTRYTAKPSEISLVDKPCVPSAKFYEVIKMDGTVQQTPFKSAEDYVDELAKMLNAGTVTPQQLVALAKGEPLAKEEGDDLQKPESVDQAEWDDMTYDEKVECIREEEGADEDEGDEEDLENADTPEKVAAHNARVEQHARSLAKAAHDVLPIEDRTGGLTQEQYDKMSKVDQEKALTDPEAKWQDYVSTAIRELKQVKKAAKPAAKKTEAPAATKEPKTEPAVTDEVKKGLGTVQNFAQCLQSLSYIYMAAQADADMEKDASPLPGELREWVAEGVEIFKDMATEEADELVASLSAKRDEAIMQMSDHARMQKKLSDPKLTIADLVGLAKGSLPAEDFAKLDGQSPIRYYDALLAKYGARNSAADAAHLQQAHDCLSKLGAMCKADNPDTGNADVTVTSTEKMDAGTQLKAAFNPDEVTLLKSTVTSLQKRLRKLERQPMPVKGKLIAFGKGQELEGTEVVEDEIVSTPGQHNPEAAQALIKRQIEATSALRKF